MLSLGAASMLLLCSALLTTLSFVGVMLIRTVQYRSYCGGRYYRQLIGRSLRQELMLLLVALLAMSVLWVVVGIFATNEHVPLRLLSVVAMGIAGVACVRVVVIAVLGYRGLQAQMRFLGVPYLRTDSGIIGPVRRSTTHTGTICVDNLDVDDSLSD